MPDFIQPQVRYFPAVQVVNGVPLTVTLLDRIPLVNGTIAALSCWITAVDASDPTAVSNTISEAAYRVFGGNLGTVTANRLDKRNINVPNSFANDVDFVVVPGTATPGVSTPLALVASNGGAAPRTGNIMITFWLNKGIWQ